MLRQSDARNLYGSCFLSPCLPKLSIPPQCQLFDSAGALPRIFGGPTTQFSVAADPGKVSALGSAELQQASEHSAFIGERGLTRVPFGFVFVKTCASASYS